MILSAKVVKDEKLCNIKNTILPNTKLVIFAVGNDKASSIYVNNKQKLSQELNIICDVVKLDEDVSEEVLLNLISEANDDSSVHGMLVQLPLPKHINEDKVIQSINPLKDVDGFSFDNIAKLFLDDKQALIPCTVKGIIDILSYYKIDVVGKNVLIVGRSNIVGKPLAIKLINNSATVISCNSRTKNIKELINNADIFISAIGSAKFFDASYFTNAKSNLVVVDVGINRDSENKLCGDVDTTNVMPLVKAITPVPGGVGVMTVVNVIENTLMARSIQEQNC